MKRVGTQIHFRLQVGLMHPKKKKSLDSDGCVDSTIAEESENEDDNIHQMVVEPGWQVPPIGPTASPQ